MSADETRTWQNDRLKLLDSRDFVNSTVRVLNGAIPGTDKPGDASKVSDAIIEMIFAELKDQQGVHVETALAAIGALAGFSVQMALREALVKPGKIAEDQIFTIVRTKSAENFYFGDAANEGLFGGKPGVLSIYGLVGGGAQQAGAKELPDLNDIAGYVARTVGTDNFGKPRIPAQHAPRTPSIDLLCKFWNPIRNFMVVQLRAPLQWPFALGLAAQKVIIMGKSLIDPSIAAKLVMETAVAMAKIEPARVHYAHFQTY